MTDVRMGYTCWLLDEIQRAELLERLPAHFSNVVAHHVTMSYGVPETHPLPTAVCGLILGEIIDQGVQALVVAIDNTTRRPDGDTFHITWSLDDGRFPENARTLTRKCLFWPFPKPIEVKLTPTFIESNLK